MQPQVREDGDVLFAVLCYGVPALLTAAILAICGWVWFGVAL